MSPTPRSRYVAVLVLCALLTGCAGTSPEGESPLRLDFSHPPVMHDPGTRRIASTAALRAARIAIADPVVLIGVVPTSIFTFRDGEGVQQSFDDPRLGQFWFAEYVASEASVTGMPDACIGCSGESGRITLSDGTRAVVWIQSVDAPLDAPSSITWYRDGVVFGIMARRATLDRGAARRLAELVLRSAR